MPNQIQQLVTIKALQEPREEDKGAFLFLFFLVHIEAHGPKAQLIVGMGPTEEFPSFREHEQS